MALSINELNAVSKKYFDPTLTQQVYEKSPFFAKLKADKKIKTDGGTSMQWTIRYQKLDNAKATGPRAKVDFQSKETRTAADIDWVFYDAQTLIHWDELVKNSGKGKIIDLLKDKSAEVLEDLQEKLYTALFATTYTSGTDLEPLAVIVDSAAAYGGIAVSDATEWAATEDSSTTTLKLFGANSLAYMRNQATFGTTEPTMHITTRDLASKFESLLQPQQRYEDKKMANLGFSAMTFHGVPVIGDAFCPAGYWYGLDMSAFELREHTDYGLKVGDWFELPQAGYPNAKAKYVSWVGNLLARRRKTSFKFSALDYTL